MCANLRPAGPDIDDELHGKQCDDAKGHGTRGGKHADQIPRTRPHHGVGGFEGIRVDDSRDRIRRIVKSIHEFEAQREEQGETQQDAGRQIDAQACKHGVAPVLF
jgi:hypothetical protein